MLHIVLFWVQYLPCGFLLSRGASTGFGGLEKKELCFIACCCWLLHRSRQISNHAWGYQLYKEALTACICRTQHLKWEQRMVKMHMTVLLLKTFAVSSLWLRLYCCCCFSVERDAALLVPQTFSAYDKPRVAVSFVAGRHSASKCCKCSSAQFSNDEILRQCLILSENFSVPSWYETVCLALLHAKCSFTWVSPLEEKSPITLWMRGVGRAGTCHGVYPP